MLAKWQSGTRIDDLCSMKDESRIWVDHRRWSESWEGLQDLPGGGQGHARKARRKRDGRTAFVKAVRAKRNTERRARFFREASAYDTMRVSGIPGLIESNAHQWENTGVEPYIATEFIEGPSLRHWRDARGDVELGTAIETCKRLLVIVSACHAGGVVHRDVKPDNIILANDDSASPWLLDFGLNHHRIEGVDFRTEHWEEVGNRFLRLPELSAGSLLKQDPRSDLSFVAGILFYMLTGQSPNVLQDAEGRLPHQAAGQSCKDKERCRSGTGATAFLS